MIDVDAVDFSERRPEEVISFFWRSVYFPADVIFPGQLSGKFKSHPCWSSIENFEVVSDTVWEIGQYRVLPE